MDQAVYKRVLLKLSGEALLGKSSFGIDPDTVIEISREIKEISDLGVQLGVVVGGGNMALKPVPGEWIEPRLIIWVCSQRL
jgi:uridylate kinase